MNRSEQLEQLINTITYYSVNNQDNSLYGIAIQIATKLSKEEDKQEVAQALLLALNHIDG